MENELSVQGHTGHGAAKWGEAGALIPVGNGEILGVQNPSSGNREKEMDLRDAEELSLSVLVTHWPGAGERGWKNLS